MKHNGTSTIHREYFIPIYEQTPKALKADLLKAIGLDIRISNFYRRQYITEAQYGLMLQFKEAHCITKNNTIGAYVDFKDGANQVILSNQGLLDLINSDDFYQLNNNHKSKVIHEQMRMQRDINKYYKTVSLEGMTGLRKDLLDKQLKETV